MSAETSSEPSPASQPDKGLPAVQAPSGRHILQLFVIPGLIVAGAVTILLGFSWLAGGSRTPEQFLKNIESSNTDIRWRAANDLAQVLKRDDQLAANVGFAMKVSELFQKSLVDLEQAEKDLAAAATGGNSKEIAQAKKNLAGLRSYVQYLGACLGSFSVPVGAPLLCDLARNGRGSDPTLRTFLRRQAVWSLANLGDNQRRFAKLSTEQQDAIRQELKSEASVGSDRAGWARTVLANMEDRRPLGVIASLVHCSKEDRDIFLREQAAHALIFWNGDADENRLAEQALLELTRDTGRGERITVDESNERP
jgi:hypothetical protein